MNTSVTFTRKQLYDLVWQKPVSRIAAEYGISDVGLSKICARHHIPTPPRGYWARAEDRRPAKPELPPYESTEKIQLPVKKSIVGDKKVASELELQIETEKRPENRIVVAERLSRPCELAREARAAMRDAEADEVGFLELPPGHLNLFVSRAQSARVLRLADALIKAFDRRGWETGIHEEQTLVDVNGVQLSLQIEEGTKTEQREVKPDFSSSYEFHHNRTESVRMPSGLLTISICEEPRRWRMACQRNWRDTKRQVLEDKLNDVIVGMLRLAAAVKDDQIREERKAQKQAERQQALEAARQQQPQRRL